MPKKTTGTDGNRGNSDWDQLLNDFQLVLKDFRWMDDAACQGRSDIDFFPEDNYNLTSRPAIELCRTCPVKDDCLEFAVENHIQYGIWGGLNYPQRRRYLRTGFQRDSF